MKQTERGVVVCPNITVDGRNFSFDCSLDDQSMRRYLLYWDKIAYAFPNGMGKPNLDVLHDLQFLTECGVLTLQDTDVSAEEIGKPGIQSPVRLENASSLISFERPTNENESGLLLLGSPLSVWPDLNYFAQVKAASCLRESGSDLWTIAQTKPSFSFPTGRSPSTDLLEGSLYHGLPVPTMDTPFEEIMQFREKRREELLRLRRAMDKLYDAVLQAQDTDRAFRNAVEEIERALIAIHRTLHESGIKTFLSTLKVYLNVSQPGLFTILGLNGLGFSLPLAAAAGLGANIMLTLACRHFEKPCPLPSELKDFMYLYEIERLWPEEI